MASKLCGIYEMLLNFNIINKIKYDELITNNHLIGEIKDKWIDIKMLSKEMEKYIIYDVVYLIDIFKYFKNQLKSTYKLISEFNRLIIFDSYSDLIDAKINTNYLNISLKYKVLFDSLNINFLTLKNKN
jgi:ribonuclease D